MSVDKYHISLGHLVNKLSHNVRMLNNNCCCSAGSLCAHFCCFGFACFYKNCVLLCSCYKRRNTDLSLYEGVPFFFMLQRFAFYLESLVDCLVFESSLKWPLVELQFLSLPFRLHFSVSAAFSN